MMKKKNRLVVSCALAPFALGAFGGGAMAQDADTAKLLKEIEAIRELLEAGSGNNNDRALTTIRSALGSPKATYEFYMDSRKQVDFDEEGKRESDWREWRDKNEEYLKKGERVQALQFQLRYLALSLKAAGGGADADTLKEVMPELISYLDSMSSAASGFEEHRNILGRSVLESVFGRRLKLNLTVDSDLPWVYSPLNVAEIYDRTVMPYYREAKDMRGLASAWDRRIIHEGKIAALPELLDDEKKDKMRRGGTPADYERAKRREAERTSKLGAHLFKEERLPELQWSKAKDSLEFGTDRIAALRAMAGLVKSHLDHKNARKWLAEVAGLAAAGSAPPKPKQEDTELVLPDPPSLPDPVVAEPSADGTGFEVK